MGAPKNLRARVLSAVFWVIGSSATGQAIRLGSNLILSRLLVPEHFGLMAIVGSLRVGSEMLSDIGIGPMVISSRVDDQKFLNSLWSIKVVRGFLLAVVVALLSYPAALWFNDQRLTGLVMITALSMASRGVGHLCEFTLARDLRQRQAFALEFTSQVVGTAFILIGVYMYRSVWALAIGGAFTDVFRTCLTHYFGRERPHRFHWDPQVAVSLKKFGRWVFLSSALTYVVIQGDRLILGSLMSLSQLGNYAIAVTLAGAIDGVVNQLTANVFFPMYSMIGKVTNDELKNRIRKVRLVLSLATVPALSVVVVFGDLIVKLLWDERYADASWMVRILGIGYLVQTFGRIGPIHLARGDSWVGLVFESVRVATLAVGLTVGYHIGGAYGIIGGLAAALAAEYPVTIWSTRRYGVWLPQVDLLAAGAAVVLVGLGELVRRSLGLHW
jgi:O-antigen/teichoic acid export membrane protein